MLTLTARQCPHCVLRFGSSSELEQHIDVDHRPTVANPPSQPEPNGVAEPVSDDGSGTEQPTDVQPFFMRAITVGALVAFVAALSWHVAVVLSVLLAVIVLARASEKAAEQGSEVTQ